MKIFSIFDSKADAFLVPFFSPTTATGLRAFESAARNSDEPLAKYPADYTLFELGEFDERTGSIVMHDAKLSLGTALELRPKELRAV